jgi:hypothetical protein
MAFRSLKYTYVGRNKYYMQTNADLDQKYFLFPCKFPNWRFADWATKEICGLIITNLRICDLRTGITHKFEDLRLRNEPKNLRVRDLRTYKNLRANLCK